MDELDFEVTDLREPPADRRDRDPSGTAASGEMRPPAQRPFAAPARSRRVRRLRGALTAAALLLVGAVLMVSIPQAPATLAALLHVPTPSPPPPLPVGADTLVLQDSVPWGVLSVDGAPVRHLGTALVPPNTQGVQVPALTLARGRHSLSYAAPPFSTLRCHISVPAAPDDSCPLAPQAVTGPLETFGRTRIVDLGARPALLPRRQRDALVRVVAAALAAQSPTTALAAGEPYLAADGQRAVAREPLVATLRYTLDTGAPDISPEGDATCGALCADSHDQGDLRAWLLAARVALSWQYAPTTGGQPFAGAVAAGSPAAVYLDVQVAWDGAWEVVSAGVFDQAECAVATAAAQTALQQQQLAGRLACTATFEHIAAGCLVTAQPLDAAGRPAGQQLALYYRFGLLFAGDAPTHQRLPNLPAAGGAALALLPQHG